MDKDIALEVQRFDYLDELGEDNTCSERLTKSTESLEQLHFIFAFAEYPYWKDEAEEN